MWPVLASSKSSNQLVRGLERPQPTNRLGKKKHYQYNPCTTIFLGDKTFGIMILANSVGDFYRNLHFVEKMLCLLFYSDEADRVQTSGKQDCLLIPLHNVFLQQTSFLGGWSNIGQCLVYRLLHVFFCG